MPPIDLSTCKPEFVRSTLELCSLSFDEKLTFLTEEDKDSCFCNRLQIAANRSESRTVSIILEFIRSNLSSPNDIDDRQKKALLNLVMPKQPYFRRELYCGYAKEGCDVIYAALSMPDSQLSDHEKFVLLNALASSKLFSVSGYHQTMSEAIVQLAEGWQKLLRHPWLTLESRQALLHKLFCDEHFITTFNKFPEMIRIILDAKIAIWARTVTTDEAIWDLECKLYEYLQDQKLTPCEVFNVLVPPRGEDSCWLSHLGAESQRSIVVFISEQTEEFPLSSDEQENLLSLLMSKPPHIMYKGDSCLQTALPLLAPGQVNGICALIKKVAASLALSDIFDTIKVCKETSVLKPVRDLLKKTLYLSM